MSGGGNLAKRSKTNNPAVTLTYEPHLAPSLLVPSSSAFQGSEVKDLSTTVLKGLLSTRIMLLKIHRRNNGFKKKNAQGYVACVSFTPQVSGVAGLRSETSAGQVEGILRAKPPQF